MDLGEREIGDGGAGRDIRGEPDFEAVEEEVRKMELDGPNAVDWSIVVSGSLDILERQSKDLLVGAWCAYALFRREKYQGLAVGLTIIRGMISQHWDALQPPAKRERARVGALDWLIGRLTPVVMETKAEQGDYPAVIAAFDALEEIDRLANEKLTKESLAVGELFRVLRPMASDARAALRQIEEEAVKAEEAAAAREAAAAQPAPAPVESALPAPTPAATPSAGAVATTFDISGAPAGLKALAEAAQSAAASDARAFLLRRVASWLRFETLPDSEGGRTLIPPPMEAIEALEALRTAERHVEALALAEDMVWTAPFYLDVHRHTIEILDALGPAFASARATVLGMFQFLVRRNEGILELSFSNGRPFADGKTRALAGGGAVAADPVNEPITQAREAAMAALAAGRVDDAFAQLGATPNAFAIGRRRLLWQLFQAEFCLENGFASAAIPLAEHVDEVVEARQLESWEPDLACRCAQIYLRALLHQDTQLLILEDKRRIAVERLRGRLSRLDLGLAIRSFRQ